MSAIVCQDLQKTYTLPGREQRTISVIRELTCEVRNNDFVLVRGPSGSGKTTLLRMLAGLTRPTSGSLLVLNNKLGQMTQSELALFRATYVGFVFQDFLLIPTLTCVENVMLPLELVGVRSSEAYRAAHEELEKVGLVHRQDHYPSQLSGGEQQRTAWARALVNSPSLFIADEPTANLDRKTQDILITALTKLSTDQNITVVVATHEVRLESLATTFLLMDDSTMFERVREPPKDDLSTDKGVVGDE